MAQTWPQCGPKWFKTHTHMCARASAHSPARARAHTRARAHAHARALAGVHTPTGGVDLRALVAPLYTTPLTRLMGRCHTNLQIQNAYDFLNFTKSLSKPCEAHAKLKRAGPKSWPDHGGTIPAQSTIYMSSHKVWHHLVRRGAPLQLHVFLICHNDSLFLHPRNHGFCMVLCPCISLLQCILTCKTCQALSALECILRSPMWFT
jgi:hypothetical protein